MSEARTARVAILASWAGSLALHAALAGTGAALVAALVSREPASTRSVSVTFDAPELSGSPEAQAAPTQRPRAADAAAVMGAANVSPGAARLAPAQEAMAVDGAPARTLLATPPVGAADMQSLSGAAPGATEFFGARTSSDALRIVYVVDASGSMISALPVVIDELAASVERLSEAQWFQVLLFQDGQVLAAQGASGNSESLLRATPENKRAALRWARSVRAARAADPLPALEHALSLQPDAVFLLSKGVEETDAVASTAAGMERITRRNREALSRLDRINPPAAGGARRVAIKVLHFMDDDRGGLLAAIGRLHGGDDGYTFLSRERLGL